MDRCRLEKEGGKSRAQFGDGPIQFLSTSGVVTVLAGTDSVRVRVNPLAMDSSTQVVATLQEYRDGVAVVAAVPHPAQHRITIYLSGLVPKDTRVAWFMFN